MATRVVDGGTGPGRRVSDVLHDRLRAEILAGDLAPGDAMSSERTLAERHGVNRHAVREALKRLEQAGLVRITQGGATRVQDWRETGGLDLLLDLVRDTGGDAGPPAEVVRSVLELRALIGVDAVRRFVDLADADERAHVSVLVEAVAVAVDRGEGPALVATAYEDLWRAVVAGSGNVAYRLMLNSLNQAVAAFPELAIALAPDDPAALLALAAAVRDGDVGVAAAVVAAQLEGDVPPA
ncbi:FadR/GntR family transcriptional regulator [Patulibacter minatonensis]|uniref:FadR/GntR family transcriptional regulator n=1 Tax=Patulibacter minatonensis TaxID=298163 RepID=UPI0006886779|nr:GntR family transcriptional regulator [Patulibacter minatonensis]